MELAGRQLKINHPTGHRAPDPPTVPLRAPLEILQQYRVATRSGASDRPMPTIVTESERRADRMPTIVTESERRADRKQRELFVGNLAAGSVRCHSLRSVRCHSLRSVRCHSLMHYRCTRCLRGARGAMHAVHLKTWW